eukprot:Gb_11117 [translate_table: standard]
MRDEFWDTAPHYGGQKVCVTNVNWEKCTSWALHKFIRQSCIKTILFNIFSPKRNLHYINSYKASLALEHNMRVAQKRTFVLVIRCLGTALRLVCNLGAIAQLVSMLSPKIMFSCLIEFTGEEEEAASKKASIIEDGRQPVAGTVAFMTDSELHILQRQMYLSQSERHMRANVTHQAYASICDSNYGTMMEDDVSHDDTLNEGKRTAIDEPTKVH